MKKALYLILCIAALWPAQVMAQSGYFLLCKEEKTESIELGGQSSFVFESKIVDLVITSSINSDNQKTKVETVGDTYRYEITVPDASKRIFYVSKSGTALRTEDISKKPVPNQRIYFTVTEVQNPIDVKNQSSGRDGYFVEGKACIQFTAPISDLRVEYSPKLGGRLIRKTAPSGANLVQLEIDMDSLRKYRDFEDLQMRYDAICKTIEEKEQTDKKSITDQEWDLQDRLDDELRKAEADWIEVATIKVYGENTNIITLNESDIKAIQPKSCIPYGILLLKEEVKVFASKYEEEVHLADNFMRRRDYELASAHYASAAEVDGISDVDRVTAKRSSEKMGTLHSYKQALDERADNLYRVAHGGGMVNKKQLFAMMDELISLYKAMYKETTDNFYLEEANRLTEEKKNVGIVIKGRFVMSEYKGGVVQETPVTNVRIYGSQDFNNDKMDSRSYSGKGELIKTITEADGHFSFNFKAGKYRAIIFEAVGNSQIKDNKHISVLGNSEDRNLKIRFPKK